MFDNLSERLERSFKLLKGEGKITEINVAETLKDVRRALLDADVNYKVAKTFTDKVKEKALGQNVLTSVKPSQLMVKIVHDELAQLMGGTATDSCGYWPNKLVCRFIWKKKIRIRLKLPSMLLRKQRQKVTIW